MVTNGETQVRAPGAERKRRRPSPFLVIQPVLRAYGRGRMLLCATAMIAATPALASAQTAAPATTTTPTHHHKTTARHTTAKAKTSTPTRAAPAAAVPAAAIPPAAAPATTSSTRNASIIAGAGAAAAAEPAPPAETENVVVTGTLFHDPNAASAAPIEELTSRDMQRRGIKTVTDALQQLSSNGSGNLTNAFGANGAFAAGASAPSLHGLTTDSTLILMDGQRLSYYPLADDGERDFVDTNWMPQSIMERIDVKEDGGSATYGADAVGGVINFITRKEIQGFEGNAEGGLSQLGIAGHQRLYATYGHGDLARDGYNFYINSEYQQDDAVYNRDVGYPYNTANLTGIGGTNWINNSSNPSATKGSPEAMVAPVVNGQAVGAYQLLNPSASCGKYGSKSSGTLGASNNYYGQGNAFSGCSQDTTAAYGVISPSIQRINATAHFTANVTPRSQFTAMFTYSQTETDFLSYTPAYLQSLSQSKQASSYNLLIPARLPNGQLNPNDPFAAQGEPASMIYQFGDIVPYTSEYNQNFRGSMRYNGTAASNWGSDWNYDFNFVGMNSVLTQTYTGYPTINGITNAVNNGTYNFVNPSQNSQSVLNSIAPKDVVQDRTQEYSYEMTGSKGLFRLPGGMVNLAIGGNIRWEALNAPNGNPYNPADPGAQYWQINPVNAQGSRWVESGFWELGLPFHKMLNVDLAGRYDNYSTSTGVGYGHYTPQATAIFKPVDQFALRGSFSRGFRVPSFSETGGDTVGYIGNIISNPAWLAAHNNDAYTKSYYVGLNSIGNPNLKPEIATNFSGGAVIKPLPWISLSADYYYIKKSNYIMGNPLGQDAGDISEAYVSGQPLPSGITVTPDVADPAAPGAPARPGLINYSYINAPWMRTDGVQLGFTASHRLPGVLHEVNWYSKGEMTYVRRLSVGLPGGGVEEYAGTIGPYNTVSASGTPRWKANWANTFTWRKLAVTPTVYYTSGYKLVAEDVNGPGASSCATSSVAGFGWNQEPSTQCHVRNYWDVDLTVNYQIDRRWSVYANVYNLLGFRSPYDYATYGSYLYNSSWSQKGIVYRSFQFGVNVKL
ncbi:TonB-dependent receptor plug domain-containing protein [Gluconacetobacter diazotrophicus]|nr:TonB-dependent receptor [Gluconacetobacter diazotrophicus]